MHFGDSIFIFLMALVLFGPKKLPEIGRQIGKLLGEFRRASNEFKYQIQEELRNMEDDDRRKKLAEEQAAREAKTTPDAVPALEAETGVPSILPPSTGTPVAADRPYAAPVEGAVAETAEAESPSPALAPPSDVASGTISDPESGTASSTASGVAEPPSMEGEAIEALPAEPEPAGIEPYSSLHAAEVLPEPPAPVESGAAPGSLAYPDLTIPANGTHPAAQESSADAGAPGEPVHHG